MKRLRRVLILGPGLIGLAALSVLEAFLLWEKMHGSYWQFAMTAALVFGAPVFFIVAGVAGSAGESLIVLPMVAILLTLADPVLCKPWSIIVSLLGLVLWCGCSLSILDFA